MIRQKHWHRHVGFDDAAIFRHISGVLDVFLLGLLDAGVPLGLEARYIYP